MTFLFRKKPKGGGSANLNVKNRCGGMHLVEEENESKSVGKNILFEPNESPSVPSPSGRSKFSTLRREVSAWNVMIFHG